MSTHPNPVDSFLAALLGKLSPEEREKASQVYAHPGVQAVRDDFDKQLLDRRIAIAARLKEVPSRWKAEIEKRVKRNNAAQKRLAELKRELADAQQEATAAQIAVTGIDHAYHSEIAQHERDLDETADPRIEQFRSQCEVILQALRHVPWTRTFRSGDRWDGSPILTTETNADEVAAARAEVARIMGELAALKRRPLNRDQVTAALKDLLLDLSAVVSGYEIDIMRLSDLGELIVDEHKGSRDLSDRASTAARRNADAEEAA